MKWEHLYAFVRPSEKLLRQCAMCLKNRRIGRWWSESPRSDCGAKKGVVEFHASVEPCWTLKKHGDWIRWPPKQLVQGQPLIEAMKSVWCMLSRLTDTNTALCKRISHFWICRWSCTCWCWLGPDLNPVHRLDNVCKKDIEHVGHGRPEAGAIALEKAMKARDNFVTRQIWWQSFVSNVCTHSALQISRVQRDNLHQSCKLKDQNGAATCFCRVLLRTAQPSFKTTWHIRLNHGSDTECFFGCSRECGCRDVDRTDTACGAAGHAGMRG